MGRIKSYWNTNPLLLILWIALILRLIAAIFSRGYGMHDDHFLVIETAQSWLDGAMYNNWFLERQFTDTPTILNFYYAGVHYLLFAVLEQAGMMDPQVKMLVVRLLHALWSMLIVYYGYRITEKLSGRDTARMAGLILATLWLMPFFGVRNLVEVACIPFLMAGYWTLLNAPYKKHPMSSIFLASLLFGLSFTLRFQTLIIPAGIGLVFLYEKKFRECIVLASGVIVIILLTQGIADWIIWGKPFTEIGEYISHNIHHRFDYTVAPWYAYILVVLGVLIPPVSLMLFSGYVYSWKKHLIIFLPTILFFIFHSYYPNKQERFIMPILPFLIILGMIGWQEIHTRTPLLQRAKRGIKGSWVFFWVVNLLLLVFFTGMYSKRARVESMTYLSRYPDIDLLIVDDTQRAHATMLPLFYLGQWPEVWSASQEKPANELAGMLAGNPGKVPAFVLFFGYENLDERLRTMQDLVPGLTPEVVIQPSLPDKVLHWLNPVNANREIHIYRNTNIYPDTKKH